MLLMVPCGEELAEILLRLVAMVYYLLASMTSMHGVQDSEVGLGRHATGVNEKFNRKSHHPTGNPRLS
jgi:hypothetical protein